MVQPLWRTVWGPLENSDDPAHDPGVPLRGTYPEKTKTLIQKAALFTIAKPWKQPECPLTEAWIKKMWYIHTMEYY